MAAESEIGVSYISNLEQGKANPTFKTSERLAGAIGVSYSNVVSLAELNALRRSQVRK